MTEKIYDVNFAILKCRYLTDYREYIIAEIGGMIYTRKLKNIADGERLDVVLTILDMYLKRSFDFFGVINADQETGSFEITKWSKSSVSADYEDIKIVREKEIAENV